VFEERESADLELWLSDRSGEQPISSELARVEVLRGCRRIDESALPQARTMLQNLELIPLSGNVIHTAGDLPDPRLRSLDVLHLASAMSIATDLTAFIAYDRRLAAAAAAAGLPTIQPGA
jgi:predicted nucleic acid-binding protein